MDNDTRAHRFTGRHALRHVTSVPRCVDCGRATLTAGGAVGVRQTEGGMVGFAGLASCGRIWLCPVCNAKVMARRAIDVGLAVTWAAAHGYQVIWGSLTVSHHVNSDLGQLIEIQRQAWRHVVSSKGWRKASTSATVDHSCTPACEVGCERKRDIVDLGTDGRVGYVRAAEITIGLNGWHPHFHPLLIWRGSVESAQAFAASVVGDWLDGVDRAGGVAIGHGAQQLRVLTPDEYSAEVAGYMTKSTYDGAAMAFEVAWSQGKVGAGRRGRARARGTVAHWAVLHTIATTTGEVDDSITRWWELEAATRGHRMLSWSRGLRDFVGLGGETTDEEEADREVGSADDTVCFISPAGWDRIRDTPAAVAGILGTLESGGWAALREYLDAWGVEWFVLETASA